MAEFDDGKDESALRTIGEVSEALGVKQHILRYWEQQFPLLKPLKRSGGRRYYRPADIAMVEHINQLINHEGYTLKGAEAVLRASGNAALDRRSGDRRAAAVSHHADIAAPERGQAGDGPHPAEILKAIKQARARLAAALEG